MNGLVVEDKAERVYRYHRSTLEHFQKLLSACGLRAPDELGPGLLFRRITPTETRSYREIFSYLEPGQLAEGRVRDSWYADAWRRARAGSFAPA